MKSSLMRRSTCFEGILSGRAILLVSGVVIGELENAPPEVKRVYADIPRTLWSRIDASPEANTLSEAYLKAGVVTPRSALDAMHVALATIGHADALVSWNYRDLVRLDRIEQFSSVNVVQGYGEIRIVSPKEVRFDDNR